MATSPVVFWQPAGLTLTARVFAVGSDTQVGTDYSPTESTNRKGRYSFDVTSGITGAHDVHVFEGSTLRAAFRVVMADDTTEKECRDPAFIISGTDAGQLNVTGGVVQADTAKWGGTAVASANVLIDGAITAAKIAADAITDAKVASDVTIASVTGSVGSVTGSVTGSVGSVVGNVGGNVLGNVLGSVDSVVGWVGGSVAGDVVGSVGSVVGNVGGNVVGSVGSISGITFPTHFAALGINVSGDVSRVTLVDTTTINTDMRGTDNAATAAQATAIEADTQDIQARIPAALVSGRMDASVGAMANNTLTAAALATDAVAEIQLGLATQATLAAIGNYVDTEVAQILADTTSLLSRLTALRAGYLDNLSAGVATAANVAAIPDALLAAGDVDGYTVEQTLRLLLAALAGKLAGATGSETSETLTLRAADDSKTRITATCDMHGNRTALTLDAT